LRSNCAPTRQTALAHRLRAFSTQHDFAGSLVLLFSFLFT
jgi:hypothetical protein